MRIQPQVSVLIFLAVSCLSGCSLLDLADRPVPPHLSEAKVFVREIDLQKADFASLDTVGEISDIKPAPDGKSIAVAGSQGAVYLNKTGKIGHTVMYRAEGKVLLNEVVLVAPNSNTGKFKFLDRGSWGRGSCLLNENGEQVWRANEKDGVDDTAYGLLSDNPAGRFVVGYNGDGGVSLLDEGGKELWNRPDGNVWHVEITEKADSGSGRIIHSNAGGEVTIRSGNGEIVSRGRAPFYFSDFSLCRWPHERSEQCLLGTADGFVWLLEQSGKEIARFPIPVNGLFGEVHGTSVRFASAGPSYLASVIYWKNWNRAIFCVHDQSGKLVFEEVFTKPVRTIALTHTNGGGRNAVLIGGGGVLLKYELGTKTPEKVGFETKAESSNRY